MKDFLKWISNHVYKEVTGKVKVLLLVITWIPLLFIAFAIIEVKNGRPNTHQDILDAMVISFLTWVGIIIIHEVYYFFKK